MTDNIDKLTEKLLETWESVEKVTPQGVESLIANIQIEATVTIIAMMVVPIISLLLFVVLLIIYDSRKDEAGGTAGASVAVAMVFLFSIVVAAFNFPEQYAKMQEPAGWAIRNLIE